MPNKTPIKAHRGMAHVPKPSGQSTPTKGKRRPPTGGRMIGLPQRFRGRGRNPLSGIIKQAPKISPKVAQPISQDSPMRQPKAPTTEVRSGRPSRPMPTTAVKEPSIPTTSVPKYATTERPKLTLGTVSDNRRTRRPLQLKNVMQPRPTGELYRPINELYRRGGRPIPLSTLLRRNRVKDSRKRQAQGMATSRGRNPRIGIGSIGSAMPTITAPLIRYNGGYVSRAKYGQTDNLKGKK